MDEAIRQRLTRLYAAIGTIEESDPRKLRATIVETEKVKAVFQDFRGGLTDDELSNQVHTVIHNIANLRDHLRRWASQNGHDKGKVDQMFNGCTALQIIQDLSNNDKHGYPPRDDGHSRRCPRLIEVNRVMRLQTQARTGSAIGMTLGANGIPIFLGDGSATAVVTGDVVDKANKPIGDLYEIARAAVQAWESVVTEFGLLPTTSPKTAR